MVGLLHVRSLKAGIERNEEITPADDAAGLDEAAAAKTATLVVDVIRIWRELATARLPWRLHKGCDCIELVEENEQEAGPPRATKPEVGIGARKERGGETDLLKKKRSRLLDSETPLFSSFPFPLSRALDFRSVHARSARPFLFAQVRATTKKAQGRYFRTRRGEKSTLR